VRSGPGECVDGSNDGNDVYCIAIETRTTPRVAAGSDTSNETFGRNESTRTTAAIRTNVRSGSSTNRPSAR
jgi:hypothetical protein